jgi:hypothetical protein
MAEADVSQVGLLTGFTVVGADVSQVGILVGVQLEGQADASQVGLLAGYTLNGADVSQVGILVGWVPIIPNVRRAPIQGQGIAGNSIAGKRFRRIPGFMGGKS